MKRNLLISLSLVLLAATALFFTTRTKAQSSNAERRITQAVDETQLVRLRGNTHPSARPQFDQGAAPADLPMERMMLVLKSGTERVAAFDTFFAQQQDRSSPNYHKWLTPDEFGQQFGVAEADIQTITSWLGSHGFSIDKVSRGRTIIVFSGSASNVKDAFHTEIHKYFVNGEEHWANASDPQIPAALTPAVVGVNTLHNFRAKPMNHRLGSFRRDKTTGKVRPLHPQFNLGTGCGLLGDTCFLVGPGDFAKIYNVPTTGGNGITIGIVNDSDILTADAQNFYSIFGISRTNPVKVNPPAGTDPGIQSCNLPFGDECEADIDTQWAGAVAPGATIDLVASATTNASNGQNIAAEFIIDSGGATFQVLSMSFGLCEAGLGAAGNAFFGGSPVTKDSIGEWQQASSEGISVVVSAGDQGAAACESPINTGNSTPPQPATTGLAVNGIASTPFNTAIGGTDFDQFNNTGQFWNGSNAAGTLVSAKSYIPEITWNDSCTNTIFTLAQLGFASTVQGNCNLTNIRPSFIVPVGGGGGASTCAIFSGASCTGGYPQPCWQGGAITGSCAQHSGITTPGNTRDLPDISMFAGSGLFNSFYPVCDQDLDPENPPNACNASNVNDIQGFGGTSVSTAAFAGIVALIDQAKGGRQGLLNPRLYSLAAANTPCASVAPTPPATNPPANCIFNDIVMGTNAQPCVLGDPPGNPTQCSSTSTAITTPTMRMFSRPTTIFIVLACVSFIGTLILGYRLNERKWSPAFAVVIFALFMTCAACGSGGSTVVVTNPTNGILTGFDAAAGYDQATGLGSVNVTALINNF
jgi:subtilase family serine protease